MSFKSLGRFCPVCEGARRDCRVNLNTGIIHCRHASANPGGQWRYIKDDAHGFGMWVWDDGGNGTDNRANRPSYAPKETTAPSVPSWPVEQRDKGYQPIVGNLTLQHRLALRKRGLTVQKIDAFVDAGIVATWPGGQTVAGATLGLPGVRPDGRLVAWNTWAVFAKNVDGQIIAGQYRNDRDPEGGKYRALSGWGGASYNVDGEQPLTVLGTTENGLLNFAEGIGFKPALGWHDYGDVWVGCIGTRWASSPKQLKAIIDRHNITEAVLNPDGGMLGNAQVIGNYRKLANLLQDWGIPLKVRWWGQTEKSHGDVDEIAPEVYHGAKLLTWAEFEAMAPDDVRERLGKQNPAHGAAVILDDDSEQVELAQDSERIQQRLLDTLQRQLAKLRIHERVAASYRIAPERPAQPAEDGDIQQFSNQDEAYKAALDKGARLIVNLSGTGTRKTGFVAQSFPHHWGVERLLFVVQDVLNADSLNPELTHWAILEGRHYGVVLDEDGKRRRATIDTPDHRKVEPGNCDKAFAAQILASKNPANPNLACLTCVYNKSQLCSERTEPNKFGAKNQQREAWEAKRILTSYGRLTGIGLGDEAENLAKAGLFLDESSSNVETTKALDIDDKALDQTISAMALEAPDLFQQLGPMLRWLRDKQYQSHSRYDKRYGMTLARCLDEVRGLIPDNLNWEALHQFEDGHHEKTLFGLDKVKLTDIEKRRLTHLSKKREATKAKLKRIDELEAKAAAADGHIFRKAKGAKATRKALGFDGLTPDERRELRDLKRSILTDTEAAELADLQARYEASKTEALDPGQAAAAAKAVRRRWLCDFIAIVLGDAPGNIRFMPDGIVATIQQTAHLDAIHSAKFTVLTDASERRTKAALAQKYGFSEHEIFIFEISQPQHKNSQLIQVIGLGRMGRNRGLGLEECKNALVAKLKELDPTHVHFDHKGYSHDARLFLDSIGSNDFKDCTSISATPPRPSINGLLDEYCVLNKTIVDSDDAGFQAFYAERYAELIRQWQGRTRANLKPGVAHTHYILTDEVLPITPDRIIPAWDICPEAARKGHRTILALVEVAQSIVATGAKLTQVALSAASAAAGLNQGKGYCQSRISDLWVDIKNGLSLFLRGSYKKSDISPERLKDLQDKAFALGHICEYLESEPPETQARDLITWIGGEIPPPDLPWILDLLPGDRLGPILGLLTAIFLPDFTSPPRASA